MGPRTGVNAMEKKKSSPARKRTRVVQPVARLYSMTLSRIMYAGLVMAE
jgi:hypothetical protein